MSASVPRATMGPRRGLWRAAGLAALGLLLSAAAAAAPAPRSIYYVRPLGSVDAAHTRFACRAISEAFRVECVVLRARPLPAVAHSPRRGQHDADRLVRQLYDDLPSDGLGLVAITNADLFESGKESVFVFGLASLVDHVAVVSLARFRSAWWGEREDTVRFHERFYKVLVHEVGHTLGVGHCHNRRCAMRGDRTIDELDESPSRFCRACRQGFAQARLQGPGTARWHYLRGHSAMSRARLGAAVASFERAVELEPAQPSMLNDLGVAYLRRGDRARALWAFREAARVDPAFPNARYNEGLVYLSAGDAAHARGAFEATLTVDSGWGLAHRQLGHLFHEVFREPERAVSHYNAYLHSQGADSDVEARLRLISGGGTAPTPR